MPEIKLPFSGFYESIWSKALDWAEEQEVRNWCETHPFSESDVSVAVYFACDYSAWYRQVAEAYVGYFNDFLQDTYDFDLGLTFKALESPREYNFTTDRIFAEIEVTQLWQLVLQVDKSVLQDVVAVIFSSRSGFISSYANDVNCWPDDISTWDHNQLGALLEALMSDDFENSLLEKMQEKIDNIVNLGIDWAKVEARLKEVPR